MNAPDLRLEGVRAAAMETARSRLMIFALFFGLVFLVMAVRTIRLGVFEATVETAERDIAFVPPHASRADILDRNGVVLATSLKTASLYADPARVLDPEAATEALTALFPDLAAAPLLEKLKSGRRFEWIKRKLTPKQVADANALGLPGFDFKTEETRVYPHGRLVAHAVGMTDIDGNGLSGIEHFFNDRLSDITRTSRPLQLSLDIRVQYAVSDELDRAIALFDAKGGAGIVMDVRSGELLALVSKPDFDPNRIEGVARERLFNRATQGVYELGSTFKSFTVALALESGTASIDSRYDAREPLKVSRFLIRDDHPQNRILTLPEVFVHSSNIGAAKMAMEAGIERQRAFLANLGLLREPTIELSEIGRPIVPEPWREINGMTIAYGHGIAVSPLHLSAALAALVNGGVLHPATLIAKPDDEPVTGRRVVSPEVSREMQRLMRLVVREGTARQADVAGYRVGGKTGTAEKATAGGYARDAVISSFAGIFPSDDPRYLVFLLVDEPKGTRATLNYAGGGWTAAPAVANVVRRIAPLLGVSPGDEDPALFQRAAYRIADSRKGGRP
ncbi:MAG: penicillin-binding protein 2 [Rhodothalassiaceae bacterium]